MSHRRFIALAYAKNLFVILGAMCALYLLIDVLVNYKKLAINSNIFLLYLLFTLTTAAYFVLPAALMLAMFATKAQLVSRNEFIALRSLGLSPRGFIAPMLGISLAVCAAFLAMSATRAAYAPEYKDAILKTGSAVRMHKDILLATRSGALVYVATASDGALGGCKIIYAPHGRLERIISAQNATNLQDNSWLLSGVKIYDFKSANAPSQTTNFAKTPNFPKFLDNDALDGFIGQINSFSAEESAAAASMKTQLQALFKEQNAAQITTTKREQMRLDLNLPKEIFEHQKSDALSLLDAIELASSLRESSLVRTSIYRQSVFLLFAPFLGAALCALLPTQTRFSELSLQLVLAIFIALVVFGCLNLLLRFSQNGALLPELGILAPTCAVIAASVYFLFTKFYR